MNDSELTALWLRITLAFGIGGSKKWQYIDIDDPKGSIDKLLSNMALQNDTHLKKYRNVSSKQIDSVISLCDKNNISVITPSDEEFPQKFRRLADPPSALFVLGDITKVADVPSVAVVGARDCCDYSVQVAEAFAGSFAGHRINVISGFARGVDRAAHLGALKEQGLTAAVLGCGILHDYPKGTMRMKRLIAEHGAVVSEYLPTTTPTKSYFKVRNRLISALADCVVVVEASKTSGSLNTVSHALEQGKEVFVIPPHDLFDTAFDGQSDLLLDGARIATHPEQIFEYLMDLYDLN